MDQEGVISYARQLTSDGDYRKAFNLYLMSFDKDPQIKPLCENEFRAITEKLNEALARSNKIEEIFSNFGKAINVFPNNVDLLNETGKYLYKYGLYPEACSQFQKALRIDPGFVNAEKNLNSTKNKMVERWHFRMLNDRKRNDSYHAAILEVTVPDVEKVLDLGTGTGILAMYATERNPMSVVACDGSAVMTHLTEAIIEANKLASSIVVLNKMSTDMVCSDVAGRRTLLLTEVFDAGLFGEHVLQSLSHAWQYLLTPEAKVIPNKAEFFIMGAKSDLLNAKYQLQTTIKDILKIPHLNVHILASGDTYDSEDAYYYQDIKYLTEPQSVVSVDFRDRGDIQEKLNYSEPLTISLKAKESGVINTYIGWFNLHLTENITLTTNPLSETRANAWQQAVFFDNIPRYVKQHETINSQLLINSGKLTLLPDNIQSIMRISQDMMKFLNDAEFMKLIKNCIGMACVYFGQMAEIPDLKIIDLCPFPLFGLLMMCRGVKSLICYAKTENDKQFTIEVFKVNKIDLSNVKIMNDDDLMQDNFLDMRFHVIFSNILQMNGELSLLAKDMFLHLKNNHMQRGGLLMPANVTLIGQIVSSHWLDINNVVYNKNVGKYKIKNHINKYQVSQNFCLDYAHLEYTALTEPVELGNCCQLGDEVFNVPIITDGEANAIICWYKLEPMEGLGYISTKRPYSFADGIAFLANPKVQMKKNEMANILCCVDTDGSFKLLIDVENAVN